MPFSLFLVSTYNFNNLYWYVPGSDYYGELQPFYSLDVIGDSIAETDIYVFPKRSPMVIKFGEESSDTLYFDFTIEKKECWDEYFYDLTINNEKIYEKCQVNKDLYYFKK